MTRYSRSLKHRLSFRVDTATRDRLFAYARRRDRRYGDVLRDMVREALSPSSSRVQKTD